MIGDDGTIYTGGDELYAINPDGSLKWSFDSGSRLTLSTLATARDGTVYFGDQNGDLFAVDSNGNYKWRYDNIGNYNYGISIAISDNGVIYASSN